MPCRPRRRSPAQTKYHRISAPPEYSETAINFSPAFKNAIATMSSISRDFLLRSRHQGNVTEHKKALRLLMKKFLDLDLDDECIMAVAEYLKEGFGLDTAEMVLGIRSIAAQAL